MIQDLIHKGLLLSQNSVFKKFVGRAGGIMAKPLKLGFLISTAYGKLIDINSPQSGFQQVKEVMLTFTRLVRAYANGSYRDVASKSMLIGVGVLLYLVSPLDIIPDFIPVIGMMDDISLMAWFIDAFQKEINAFRTWEQTNSLAPNLAKL